MSCLNTTILIIATSILFTISIVYLCSKNDYRLLITEITNNHISINQMRVHKRISADSSKTNQIINNNSQLLDQTETICKFIPSKSNLKKFFNFCGNVKFGIKLSQIKKIKLTF